MRAALFVFFLIGSYSRAATADCEAPASCVDAEPLWLNPAAARFSSVADTKVPGSGQLGVTATFGFRQRPAVVTVPAPNRYGRDVNLLRHATDATLGARVGLGNRLELTLLVPAGLYQRGAGIKGVTDQASPAIARTSVHDPRVGFGYVLREGPHWGLKIRFEAKLPLGNTGALSGEASFVASPSLAVASQLGGFFAGAEVGARLRRPADIFGLRIGSQASLSAGMGYELRGPRLSFAGEVYALPSLIDSGKRRYLPAEWLATARWSPRRLGNWSLGVSGGSGLPLSGDAAGSNLAFGVPSFRVLAFVRLLPVAD